MLHPSHSPPQAAVDPLATAKADLLSKPTYCPATDAEVEPAWTGGCVSLATGAVLRVGAAVRPTSADQYRAINCGACGVHCDAKCQCRKGKCASGNACVLGDEP